MERTSGRVVRPSLQPHLCRPVRILNHRCAPRSNGPTLSEENDLITGSPYHPRLQCLLLETLVNPNLRKLLNELFVKSGLIGSNVLKRTSFLGVIYLRLVRLYNLPQHHVPQCSPCNTADSGSSTPRRAKSQVCNGTQDCTHSHSHPPCMAGVEYSRWKHALVSPSQNRGTISFSARRPLNKHNLEGWNASDRIILFVNPPYL